MIFNTVKRLIDILISTLLLIILLPLLLIIIVVQLMVYGRGCFFLQRRYGHHGRLFTIVKFRTMVGVNQKKEIESVLNIEEPARVNPWGLFLRQRAIDELPQLLNVFMGSMSLVGPRPITKEETEVLTGAYRSYLKVKPGMACLWQLERGEGFRDIDFKHQKDMEYIEKRSLWLDLMILARTAALFLKMLFSIKKPNRA